MKIGLYTIQSNGSISTAIIACIQGKIGVPVFKPFNRYPEMGGILSYRLQKIGHNYVSIPLKKLIWFYLTKCNIVI
jgi:hypothetical protein